MQHLNILAVQADLLWENAEGNLRHLAHLLGDAHDVDVVVLPEMFATGFTMKPEKFAQPMDGPAVQWMCSQSEGRAVCGSLSIVEEGQYYNRFLWAEDGEIKYSYDKRHLFGYGNEPKHYVAGDTLLILEYRGWKIQPFVCYDLRFPVWCRNTAGVDLQLFVANWPQVRIAAWEKLLQARAIENQCFVLGVNRVGEDGNGIYHNGNSLLSSPRGEVMWKSEMEETATKLKLDQGPLLDFRGQFPVLNDRDDFSIL
jgi:omega-amidase